MRHSPRDTERRRRRDLAMLAAAAAACVACLPLLSVGTRRLPAEVAALREEAVLAREDYERGIGLIVGGNEILGRGVIAAASDRISRLAARCSRLERCDTEMFVATLADALRGRALAPVTRSLPNGDPRIVSRKAPEADRSPVLRGVPLRERIPLNRPVRAALGDWLTWKRDDLLRAWRNYTFLRSKIAPLFEEAGLPEALLFAIMATESGGKAHIYSRAGAAGPLQLMRHTARRYGLGSDDGFDERLDPVAAARASARYLNDRLDALDGDLPKTLAAYNVGETRLRRLHQRLDGAGFWDPPMQRALPRETRSYVPRVLAAALIFMQPDEFGVEFPVLDTRTTTIALEEDAALGELAVCLGQLDHPDGWFRTLRNLNPRVRLESRLQAGDTLEVPLALAPLYARRCLGDDPLREWARSLQEAGYP